MSETGLTSIDVACAEDDLARHRRERGGAAVLLHVSDEAADGLSARRVHRRCPRAAAASAFRRSCSGRGGTLAAELDEAVVDAAAIDAGASFASNTAASGVIVAPAQLHQCVITIALGDVRKRVRLEVPFDCGLGVELVGVDQSEANALWRELVDSSRVISGAYRFETGQSVLTKISTVALAGTGAPLCAPRMPGRIAITTANRHASLIADIVWLRRQPTTDSV